LYAILEILRCSRGKPRSQGETWGAGQGIPQTFQRRRTEAISETDQQVVRNGIFFPVERVVTLHRLRQLVLHQIFHLDDVQDSSRWSMVTQLQEGRERDSPRG